MPVKHHFSPPVIVNYLSSAMRDIIRGVGLAYDPVPCPHHGTFIESDLAALIADTEALYLDWWAASRVRVVIIAFAHKDDLVTRASAAFAGGPP